MADFVFPVEPWEWLAVVAFPGNMTAVPSPQTTLRLETVPSGSEAVIVKVIEVPV